LLLEIKFFVVDNKLESTIIQTIIIPCT